MRLKDLRRINFPNPAPDERNRNVSALKWALFDVWDYEPHSAQCDCHISMDTVRYLMAIAGTRGGKSLMAGREAAAWLHAGAVDIWLVAPTYGLGAKEFEYVYNTMTSQEEHDLFGEYPLTNAVFNESQGNMEIRTVWGASIRVISLERKEGAFGAEVDLIILCEGAQIKQPKNTWEKILRGRIASRLGKVIIPTTPAGQSSERDPDEWLYGFYNRGYDPDYPEYYTREWPSWENPQFPEDPYALQNELDPLIFAEQYAGKFVIFSGSVYKLFNEAVHVIPRFKIPKHWRRYEAIDPGFRGQFAWISSVVSESGTVYIVDEYYDSELLYKDRVENIKNKRCEQYGIPHGMWDVFARKNNIQTVTYIDPEDPQCAAELTSYGLPCIKANNNVMVGVDRVNKRLRYSSSSGQIYRPRLYVVNSCVGVHNSFKSHKWGEKNSTGLRKPADDRYKHSMDCVRYICAGSIVPSVKPITKPGEYTLYDMMLDITGARTQNPLDMNAYQRRMAS